MTVWYGEPSKNRPPALDLSSHHDRTDIVSPKDQSATKWAVINRPWLWMDDGYDVMARDSSALAIL